MTRWIGPDEVLPRALRVLAAHAPGPAPVCIVLDLRGRVRVAAGERERDQKPDARSLAEALSAEIGGWFKGPVVDQNGSPAHRRIAGELLANPPPWPVDWPRQIERADGTRSEIPRWFIGRSILPSKESWLGTAAEKPAAEPKVVSFYSFKGGVGRTTTLACVAARLSQRTSFDRALKVVAVDLDLEAPGLGSFLGARGKNGVLDHVLSHLATGDVGEVDPEPVEGFAGLWVLPAGRVGHGYLEKLARLDFLATSGSATASPTEKALRALLAAIAKKVAPDVVLLDSRAGLHDLGGLALHRLSHLDILLSRASVQAREGMHLVLDAIRRLRAGDECNVRLVQTMVPLPLESDAARPVVEAWRGEMYELCEQTIYLDLPELPQLEEETAHYPLLVGERAELTRADRLGQVAKELLPSYDPIVNVVASALSEEEED